MLNIARNLITKGSVVLATVFLILYPTGIVNADACTAPTTNMGTDTISVNVQTDGTYQVWSRIKAPNTTDNEYMLQIDNDTCYTVGGGSIPANSWQWVDDQDGNTNSPIDVSLSAGTHTIELIGTQPGVEVDNLIFTADTTCTPTGDGSNCSTPVNNTPPTVSITAPTDGATISGTVTVESTALDSTGITQVEFLIDGAVVATDTAVPYNYSLDTSTLSNGTHSITAEAFDADGNTAESSISVTVQNGSTATPTAPSSLSATASAYNNVNLSWSAGSNATDVAGYYILRNGTNIDQVEPSTTTYSDGSVDAATNYSYQVEAFDGSGNVSAPSNTVAVTTPSAPSTATAPDAPTDVTATAVSSDQVNLTWNASTSTSVTGYYVYRSSGGSSATQIGNATGTSYGDANLSPRTAYTYYVEAYDAAGDTSPLSAPITVTTDAAVTVPPNSNTAGSNTSGTSSTLENNSYTSSPGSSTGFSTTGSGTASGSSTTAGSSATSTTANTSSTAGSKTTTSIGTSSGKSHKKTKPTTSSPHATCHPVYKHWWEHLEIWRNTSCSTKPGTISGTVSTGRKHLTGATILIKTSKNHTEINTTNSDGEYTVSNLSPGTYTITYGGKGYSSKSVHVTVTSGQVKKANVTLGGNK